MDFKEAMAKFVVFCTYIGLWFIISIVVLAMGLGLLGMIIWTIILVKVYKTNQ